VSRHAVTPPRGAQPPASRATSNPPGWRGRFARLDQGIARALAGPAIPLLRIALGINFFWFGALKFFPGLSPAEDLATRTIEVLTFGIVGAGVSLPALATLEVLIGLGLLSGRFLRAVLAMLAVQMVGTMTPLVLFPAETFTIFPIAPTLAGQYILKNMVLAAAAAVVGATVGGWRLQLVPPSR
jgi:uncharacterized membrane protein YphA (DoxX/SURF4 family)